MNYPDNWQELVSGENTAEVYIARAFRPSSPDCVQFTDSENAEHLAVHSLTPYGEAESLDPEVQEALLDTEAQGEDYTVLKVPQGTLTIRQASFGNGKERALDLRDSYRQLGHLASRLTESVASPILSLADFGIDKRTGKLILLPPLDLGHGTQNPGAQLEGIATSISKTFKSLLPYSVCLELVAEVKSGFGEKS